MLSDEVIEYYNGWYAQIKSMIGDTTEKAFARFGSLYPVQDRLCHEATEALVANGIEVESGNKACLTSNLVKYLGAIPILSAFTKNGNDKDISDLVQMMEHTVFNITLNNRQPEPEKDALLLEGLKSSNADDKAIAIVRVIYQVRCNHAHGDKSFDQIQILLLEPLSNLLTTINKMLFTALNK